MAKTYEEIIADIQKRGLKTSPSEQKGWLEVPEYGNETGGWIAENNLVVRPSGHASIMIPEGKSFDQPKAEPEEKEVMPKLAPQVNEEERKKLFQNFDSNNKPTPVFTQQQKIIPLEERIKDVREEDVDKTIINDLIQQGGNPDRIKEMAMTLDKFPNLSREKKLKFVDKNMENIFTYENPPINVNR